MYMLLIGTVVPYAFVNVYKQKLKQVNLDMAWFWQSVWQVVRDLIFIPASWRPGPHPHPAARTRLRRLRLELVGIVDLLHENHSNTPNQILFCRASVGLVSCVSPLQCAF
ncbi:Uncharacterized protein SCF082_LOCUS10964 [Durusdinium trenchii]